MGPFCSIRTPLGGSLLRYRNHTTNLRKDRANKDLSRGFQPIKKSSQEGDLYPAG